jgi:hypothetical protein
MDHCSIYNVKHAYSWPYKGSWPDVHFQLPCSSGTMWNIRSTERTQLRIENRGVTKRCRLSWLTNSALVYKPKRGGRELWGLSQWVQLCAWNSNKLWRSNSIFNLWIEPTSRSPRHLDDEGIKSQSPDFSVHHPATEEGSIIATITTCRALSPPPLHALSSQHKQKYLPVPLPALP